MDSELIIKLFSQEGFILRPTSLQTIQDFLHEMFKNQINQNFSGKQQLIRKIIENIKIINLNSNQMTNLVELAIAKQAIDYILLPSIISNQSKQMRVDDNKKLDVQEPYQKELSQIDKIIHAKLQDSIVILDNYKEIPRAIITQQGLSFSLQQTKNSASGLVQGKPDDKVNFYINRYKCIKERLEKNKFFKFSNQGSSLFEPNTKFISDIGTLIGSKGQTKIILGIIYEGLTRQYFMQDQYSTVKLDISQAIIEKGYVLVSCIMLAEGYFNEQTGKFIVNKFYHPFRMEREQFQCSYRNIGDDFGAFYKMQQSLNDIVQLEMDNLNLENADNFKKVQKILRMSAEKQSEMGIFDVLLNKLIVKQLSAKSLQSQNQMDQMNIEKDSKSFELQDTLVEKKDLCVLVLSDFLISDRKVLNKFQIMLEGIKQYLIPMAFILIGQLFSKSEVNSQEEYYQMKQSLIDFKNVLDLYPNIRDSCYFILIPHVNDLGISAMPKPALPSCIFEDLKKSIPYLILSQNPCRMTIFNKEFIIARNDILKDLRKQSIVPNETSNHDQHLIDTILCQGNISPVPLMTKPTFWNYDAALTFQQAPHFLILADAYCPDFNCEIGGDQQDGKKNELYQSFVINPGSFLKKQSFCLIYPLKPEVELSEIKI